MDKAHWESQNSGTSSSLFDTDEVNDNSWSVTESLLDQSCYQSVTSISEGEKLSNTSEDCEVTSYDCLADSASINMHLPMTTNVSASTIVDDDHNNMNEREVDSSSHANGPETALENVTDNNNQVGDDQGSSSSVKGGQKVDDSEGAKTGDGEEDDEAENKNNDNIEDQDIKEKIQDTATKVGVGSLIALGVAMKFKKLLKVVENVRDDIEQGRNPLWNLINGNSTPAPIINPMSAAQMDVARVMAIKAATNVGNTVANAATATAGAAGSSSAAAAASAGASSSAGATVGIGVTAALTAVAAAAAASAYYSANVDPTISPTLSPVHICDSYPEIYNGKIFFQLGKLDRTLEKTEKETLVEIFDEIYNEVMGGCDDIYERFGNNFTVAEETLEKFDNGIPHLDVVLEGSVRCYGCIPTTPFFGERDQRKQRILTKEKFIQVVEILRQKLDSIVEETRIELVYAAEIATEYSENMKNGFNIQYNNLTHTPSTSPSRLPTHLPSLLPTNIPSMNPTAAPVHVCNVDPEVYSGNIVLRLGYLNRTLTSEEKEALSLKVDGSYNGVMGGCDDVYERFSSDAQVSSDVVDVLDNGIYYVDVVVTGDVSCYLCNATEPFFGVRIDSGMEVGSVVEPDETGLSTNATAIEIIRERSDTKFIEMLTTLSTTMDDIFPGLDVQLVYAAENGDLNFISDRGVQLVDLTLAPSMSPSDYPSMNPTAAPVHVCNVDPEVYSGNIVLRLGYLNRTLTLEEKEALSLKVDGSYNDVMGGCNDVYERFSSDVQVSSDVVDVLDNGIYYVDVVVTGDVSCYLCNATEPFFGVRIDSGMEVGSVVEPDETGLSTNATAIEIIRERSDTKFIEMLTTLSTTMDDIFPGLDVQLVYAAENGDLNFISDRGVQLVDLTLAPSMSPSDYPSMNPTAAPVHVCNVDPEVYSGNIVLRLGYLNRTLTLEEKEALSLKVDGSYNDVMGGCNDVYERFSSDVQVSSDVVDVLDNGIYYVDVVVTGDVSCYLCNATEPFFGVRIDSGMEVGSVVEPDETGLSTNATAIEIIRERSDTKFIEMLTTLSTTMDDIFPGLDVQLVYAAENGDLNFISDRGVQLVDLTLAPSMSPSDYPSMNPTAAPVHVCNVDPEVYSGNIVLRLGYLNRTLTLEEKEALSLKVDGSYNDVMGGCNDVYERFSSDVQVSSDVVDVLDNGIYYVDVVVTGDVSCYLCNATEPFFGVRIDSGMEVGSVVEPDETGLSTNATAIEIIRERSDTKFIEMLTTLSTTMDDIFPGLDVQLVYAAENGDLNFISDRGVQLVDLTLAPSMSPSDYPSSLPSFEPTFAPSILPSSSPTFVPSLKPSISPSSAPSLVPSNFPSILPSKSPSVFPSSTPSRFPSFAPSLSPSGDPTSTPSLKPSLSPSFAPTPLRSYSPSLSPSDLPSRTPSFLPTVYPSLYPSPSPSKVPSIEPTSSPSISLSSVPSGYPSDHPSSSPSIAPPCEPEELPITDVSVGTCSSEYSITPIVVERHKKSDNCISMSFKQNLISTNDVEFVFIEFLDCDRPSTENKRCTKTNSVTPSQTIGPMNVKCTDGFAFVKVLAQDENVYADSDIVGNIPRACYAPATENSGNRCEWEFKIPCTC